MGTPEPCGHVRGEILVIMSSLYFFTSLSSSEDQDNTEISRKAVIVTSLSFPPSIQAGVIGPLGHKLIEFHLYSILAYLLSVVTPISFLDVVFCCG